MECIILQSYNFQRMWENSLPKNIVTDAVEVSIKAAYFQNMDEKIMIKKSSINN